jgi:predicted O-methyltransferase YrrM
MRARLLRNVMSAFAATAADAGSRALRAARFAVLVIPLASPLHGSDDAIFDIPHLSGITIDGSAKDWSGGGFRVDLLPDPGGRFLPADDFDVRFRLGWTDGGLCVLARVTDDIPDEQREPKRLWQKDCIELYVAEARGHANMYQVVVAPGADPASGSMRVKLYDHRNPGSDPPRLETEQAGSVHEGGYVIEALLPWRNLGIEPGEGDELAFQLIANDSDGRGEDSFRAAWFPEIGAYENTGLMHSIRLAAGPSPPVTVHASRRSTMEGCVVTITAPREAKGSGYVVTAADRRYEGKLEELSGRAGVRLVMDDEDDGGIYPQVTVAVPGSGTIARFDPVVSMKHILERYIGALGGREAMEKLDSRYCRCRSWTENLDHSSLGGGEDRPGGETSFEMTVDEGGRWLYEDLSSDPPVRRGFDGSEGWEQNRDGIYRTDLSGFGVTVWWIDPLGALRMDRYFSDLEAVEPGPEEGGEVYAATGKLPGGRKIRLVFDRRTGLLEKAGRLHLTEYREESGVVIPHLIYFDSRAARTRFSIEEVRDNVSPEDGMFEAPDPSAEFPEIFGGITDERVLPMLEHLPTVHGGMNVPAADGRFLHDLIIEKGYKRGLEIGTSNGYSALWLGLAFRETGGELITIEYDGDAAREAADNFKKAGLDGVIDLRINDAFDEIPGIEGEFDFVFIDAWKPDYIRFLELIRGRVKPGGAITAHNVISQERPMHDFLEAIESDPGLETAIVERSTEGISVSIVKE